MKSIHETPAPVRLVGALARCTIGSVTRPRQLLGFAKSWLRFPLEYSARTVVNGTPPVSLPELFPGFVAPPSLPPLGPLQRHDWNVRLDEKIYIALIVQAMQAKRIFEIGTFDGGTTLAMAQAAGDSAQLWTLDLPPQQFDRTQSPDAFSGTQVGSKFAGTPAASRITQLLGDSTRFDFTPYLASMDVVFVDAAHDYIHGFPDSRNALKLARPGGIVLWHDYTDYWPELVHAVRAAARPYHLQRLAGTTLALVKTDAKQPAPRL